MNTTETKKTIEPERWYNLLEIVELGLFPWCKDIKTVRNWIHTDKISKDKLKAMIIGSGRQARYRILGKNIIVFITNYEDGSYT